MNGPAGAPRKSRHVLIGILVMAAGLVGAVTFGLVRTYLSMASIQRFQAPGTKDLALEAGPHTLYWETSLFEGVVQPEMTYTMASKDGEELTLDRVEFGDSYSLGNRSGVAFLKFRAPKAGTYVLTVSPIPGKESRTTTLGVRPGSGWKDVIITTVGSLAVLAVGAGAGIWILMAGARRASDEGGAHA